jgi:hypothetical protein
MERRAMTSSVLAALVTLAALFAAGDACDHVPSMSWDDACLRSCNFKQAWTKLCEDTLSSSVPPLTDNLTVFALVAARQAKLRYQDTIDLINQMLGAGNLPKDERLLVDHCKEKYVAAHGLLANIVDQLEACDLTNVRQEYLDAQVSVWSCQSALSLYQSLQLYSMVSADFDMTMVAYELGALIVGK